MPPQDHHLDPPYRLETDTGGAATDGVAVVRIGGDLDYVGTPRIRRRLLDEVETTIDVLIVDLTDVTLLSAAAMEMLLALDVLAAARGCEVRVVAAGRTVRRPLRLTGLDERLRVFPSVEAARRAAV